MFVNKVGLKVPFSYSLLRISHSQAELNLKSGIWGYFDINPGFSLLSSTDCLYNFYNVSVSVQGQIVGVLILGLGGYGVLLPVSQSFNGRIDFHTL